MRPYLSVAAVLAGLGLLGCSQQPTEIEAPPTVVSRDPAPAEPVAEGGIDLDMTMPGGETAATGDSVPCPIMGNPIDLTSLDTNTNTAEYDGRVYYFCCAGCAAKFLEDPETVIAEHPEWAEKASKPLDDPSGADGDAAAG